jgi:hypothetical protein
VSRRCTVCSHPDVDVINAALVSGTKQADLVSRHGCSKDALSRHFVHHIPAELAKAHAAEEVAAADNLLGLVQEQLATARRVAAEAEKAGEKRTTLLAVRELLRIVELEARLAGQLGGDGATVNVIVSPQWHRTRETILVALSPYPEARVAVAAALQTLEAGS